MNQNNDTIRATADDFTDTVALQQGRSDEQNHADEPARGGDDDTVAFPEVEAYKALSEAPTQTLNPERIKAQNAQTETMTPLTDTTTMPSTTTIPAEETSLPKQLTLADLTSNERPADAEPTAQPMTDKPAVALAGAEGNAVDANGGSAVDVENASTSADNTDGPVLDTPIADGSAPAAARQQEAWHQQQAAAQEYAGEARRNSYPGSGNTYQQMAGTPYANYPGWNQYAPVKPAIEYKTGPSAPTIVWGVIIAMVAVGGLAGSWMFGFSPTSWSVLLILVLVVLGLVLVIGGVVAAFRRPERQSRGKRTAVETTAVKTTGIKHSEPKPSETGPSET